MTKTPSTHHDSLLRGCLVGSLFLGLYLCWSVPMIPLYWDYDEPMDHITFEVQRSSNLRTWAFETYTTNKWLMVPATGKQGFFRVRASNTLYHVVSEWNIKYPEPAPQRGVSPRSGSGVRGVESRELPLVSPRDERPVRER